MKAAWVGVAGTLLGALIAVGAQPIVTEWFSPREGTYSLEQSCLSSENLDPAVAKQIRSYPCQLRVAHVEGPAIQKLSVIITSRNRLADLKTDRNDENVTPTLTNNDAVLSLDIPTLRENSVVDVRFASVGEPDVEMRSVRESGRLVTENEPQTQPWTRKWYGIALFVVAYAVAAFGLLYLIYSVVLRPVVDNIPRKQKLIGAGLILLAVIPVLDIGPLIQTAMLVAILHTVSGKKFP